MNIEKIKCQTGHDILKYDETLLCSKVDPVKEADQWVEKSEALTKDVPNIIVLGLGSGFHIIALKKRYPKKNIIVIEPNSDIIKANNEIHPIELTDVTIVNCKSSTEALESSQIKKALRDLYTVVNYVGAFRIHSDFFKNLQEIFIGRGEKELQYLLSIRPKMKELIEGGMQPREVKSSLLSIKTLNDWIKKPIEDHEIDFMAIRALKELVN